MLMLKCLCLDSIGQCIRQCKLMVKNAALLKSYQIMNILSDISLLFCLGFIKFLSY